MACWSKGTGAAVVMCCCSVETELEEEDTAAVSKWVGGEVCCGEAAVTAPWQHSKCRVMSTLLIKVLLHTGQW